MAQAPKLMTILGIDPGIARCGYAILEHKGSQTILLQSGCITTKSGGSESLRLLEIKRDLETIIRKFQPEAMSIESLFFINNQKTAMHVGQARGVALLAAGENHLRVIEVTPLQVKIAATGYGQADKKQVETMIVKLLKLKKIPKPDDAADACAIAWAGIGRSI